MCGIAGIVSADTVVSEEKCRAMERNLGHRGPDDGECWISSSARVGFVHCRLSILDLSPTGHQPMHSADGRFTIVFNGEIYNFAELRNKLVESGLKLRSSGDTEVVLELYAQKGPRCVDDLAGMFAFAIWDHHQRELFLARDGLGIKPLYVWQGAGQIAFASELRALMATGLPARKLSSEALAGYLLMGSVQEPHTLVDGVQMLTAGTTLTWRDGTSKKNTFWSIQFPEVSTAESPAHGKTSHHVTLVREALSETVARHFVSDVPVGIFLSGGIDSTALVALAKQQGFSKIKTFSIAFNESEFNEGDLALRTAKHFGTEHHQWQMTPGDGQSLFDQFLAAMDQPSNDGFNSYCVSKFAHDQGMKVVLSGLGGDELFGSYPSFKRIPQMVAWHRRLGPFRYIASTVLRTLKPTTPKIRLAEFLQSAGGAVNAYQAMRGSFSQADTCKLVSHYTGQSVQQVRSHANESLVANNIGDQVSYLELTRYMRNQLLRDSDVMSMAWGLELRVPFVDRRLIECVTRIPAASRLSTGKKLLVDAVGEIPKWILEQPKRGFRFPFQEWIGGNKEWSNHFESIVSHSPVRLTTWYQKWMLVVLEQSIAKYC
jgi:asparagine synthase (glutamine-hydrolysing)